MESFQNAFELKSGNYLTFHFHGPAGSQSYYMYVTSRNMQILESYPHIITDLLYLRYITFKAYIQLIFFHYVKKNTLVSIHISAAKPASQHRITFQKLKNAAR